MSLSASRLGAGLVLATGLLLPAAPILAASAVSPQATLVQSLTSLAQDRGPMAMDGRFKISSVADYYRGKDGKLDAQFRIVSRTTGGTLQTQQSEGQIVAEKLSTANLPDMDSFTLPSAMGFEWKYRSGQVFFRVKDVPADLVAQLPEELRPYVNSWLRADLPQDVQEEIAAQTQLTPDAAIAQFTQAITASMDAATAKKLLATPAIQVTGIERRFVVNGHQMLRLKARINPAFVNLLQQAELKRTDEMYKSWGASAAVRAEGRAGVNTRYAEAKRVTNALRFAFEIDTTAKALTRIEMGGTVAKPLMETRFRSARPYEVRIGTQRTTLNLGLNLKRGPQPDVVVPSEATEILSQIQRWMSGSFTGATEPAIGEDLPMPTEDATGTY
jgi:hypothetical protein